MSYNRCMNTPAKNKYPRWFRHVQRRPNLAVASVLGLAMTAVLCIYLAPARAILISFNVACIYYLVCICKVMTRASPATMKQRARINEESKWTLPIVAIVVASIVLIALYQELHAGKTKSLSDAALAGATMLLSWFFLAIIFAQQYAFVYYVARDCEGGGLSFPSTAEPDYWDFAYFSVVLSMTFQVSDVQITSRKIRHLALLHSITSFFYNVVIVAISVNVVAGIL